MIKMNTWNKKIDTIDFRKCPRNRIRITSPPISINYSQHPVFYYQEYVTCHKDSFAFSGGFQTMWIKLDRTGTWIKLWSDTNGPMNRRNFLTRAKEWLQNFWDCSDSLNLFPFKLTLDLVHDEMHLIGV